MEIRKYRNRGNGATEVRRYGGTEVERYGGMEVWKYRYGDLKV